MSQRCTLLDEDGDDEGRCVLEAGHDGLCVLGFDEDGESRLEQCSGWVYDTKGNRAHCIRADGHDGPHAAGWSLDAPETCGETERGTGRVCLRQPHPHWPDAHDYGAPDESMTTPPAWWAAEGRDPALWPGGPIGHVPDMPFWFYPPQRPADDQESIANKHDTSTVFARRHQGPGYSEGGHHVASIAEVRGMIDSAVQMIVESDVDVSGANENAGMVSNLAASAVADMEEIGGALRHALEQLSSITGICVGVLNDTAVPGQNITGAEIAASQAQAKASAAAGILAAAADGAGNSAIGNAAALAQAAAGNYADAAGPLIIGRERLTEALGKLQFMITSIQSAVGMVPESEFNEVAAACGRTRSELEDGYRSAAAAREAAEMYSRTL